MNDNCIFCKIINNELDSVKIYEDELCIAILDKFPTVYGHILVLPKKHYQNIFDIDDESLSKISICVKKISLALKKLGFLDINLLQNNGELAGQTVNHFHMHIIPRTKEDNFKIQFSSEMAEDEILLKIKEDIQRNI